MEVSKLEFSRCLPRVKGGRDRHKVHRAAKPGVGKKRVYLRDKTQNRTRQQLQQMAAVHWVQIRLRKQQIWCHRLSIRGS